MSDSTQKQLADIESYSRIIKQNISAELSRYIHDCLEVCYHQGARDALNEYDERQQRMMEHRL